MIEFTPMLTPKEMVEAGIFGGAYFSKNAGPLSESNIDFSMFIDLPEDSYRADKYLPRRNKFKTRAGLNYDQWKGYGWFHEDDPYGWFEWYCKYYSGRRHRDDKRQIERWYKICGPEGRWRNRLYSIIKEKNTSVDDISVSPRIRQTLLHWGYLANERDYSLYCK